MRRFRALVLVVLGSLACAGLGYAAALTMAPSRGDDAMAPPTGPVTAEVELRRITSAVVARGDAHFADPVELVVRSTAPLPVVTGSPKRVGDAVAAGEVVLEVAGRPVIVLRGSLPAYRDLAPGDVGPDVEQLEVALSEVGTDPGEVDEEFTALTAAAVADLYERLGYEPPTAAGADEGTGEESSAGTPSREAGLPMSEVAYVPTLPRRVDRAPAVRGKPLPKVPILLSGSELVVSVGLTTADTEVLRSGMRVAVGVPGRARVRGRLGPVTTTTTGGRTSVRLPQLSREEVAALRGTNVKVTIPLKSTRDRVLVVPLAALSTDAGGTVRVVRIGPNGSTEAVEVRLGLAAEGFVEVRTGDDGLAAGDRVVVGT